MEPDVRIVEVPLRHYLGRGGWVYLLLLGGIGWMVARAIAPQLVEPLETAIHRRVLWQVFGTAVGLVGAGLLVVPAILGDPNGKLRWQSLFRMTEVAYEGEGYLFIESKDSRPVYSFRFKSDSGILDITRRIRQFGVDPDSAARKQVQYGGRGDFDEVIGRGSSRARLGEERWVARKRVGWFNSPYDREHRAVEEDEMWVDVYLVGSRYVSFRGLLAGVTMVDIKLLARGRTISDESREGAVELLDFLDGSREMIGRIKEFLQGRDAAYQKWGRILAVAGGTLVIIGFLLPTT